MFLLTFILQQYLFQQHGTITKQIQYMVLQMSFVWKKLMTH